jgi:cation-transporting ATPase F
VIFGVVLINTLVGYLQETKAQAALDALRSMVRTETRTVRDGRTGPLPSEALVPGDLGLVEAGDKVPADVRLIRLAELQADESARTGESQPVMKDQVALPVDTPVADRRNMLYAGTADNSGAEAGVVVATGAATELGEIHRLVGAAASLATPLTRKLARFSRVLTVVILALAAVTSHRALMRDEGDTRCRIPAVPQGGDVRNGALPQA